MKTASEKPLNSKYSATIDAMRLMVCIALALGHYRFGTLFSVQADDILVSGFASAIFFVLSGFVVVNSSQFWSVSWFRAATSRFSRLWPHHFVAFLVLVPFSVLGLDTMPLEKLLKVLAIWALGLQSIGVEYAFQSDLNGPAWCITALLIGGAILPALKHWKFNQFSNKTLWLWLTLFVLLRIGIEVVQGIPTLEQLEHRHIAILPRILAIFSGGILAILFRRQTNTEAFTWLRTDLAFFAFSTTILALLVYARAYHGKEVLYMVAHGGMTIPSLLMVIAAYLNRSNLHRLCDKPWIKKGAELSIYIYLLHIPVLMLLQSLNWRLSPAGSSWINFAGFWGILLMMIVTIAASYAYAPLGSQLQKSMNRMWESLECKFHESQDVQSERKTA